ncbi:MAG: DUF6797 domain-containing protein [Gemmataceae bacterium]
MYPFAIYLLLVSGYSGVATGQTLSEQLLTEGAAALAQAARKEGDPQRGALVFHLPYLACSKCHTAAEGAPLGPDLTRLEKTVTAEHLVESVLVPSKVIRKGYEPVTVLTTAGKSVTGLLVRDDKDGLVLRDPATGKPIAFKADEIDERQVSKTSIMPEGLANQLASRQQFLDLAHYLIQIHEGGPARAAQLQPPAELLVVQVPEYEKQVDHAGLLADWARSGPAAAAFRRGEAIYNRLCVNCHGTKDVPGSLPTSAKFARDRLKNGSDPYRMYQTLTHGFGQMAAQTWMVPQQKYDVIHYIREVYFRPHNPSQYTRLDSAYVAALPKGTTRGPAPSTVEPWSAMNYGPFLTATYEAPAGGGQVNIAYKGIAVRLDSGPGGVARGRHWMVYEHDTLRLAAAWSKRGDTDPTFIDWNGINFNGRHMIHPRLSGTVAVSNPNGPGWANPDTGRFDDPRLQGRDGRRYGPLPATWAKYRGLYQHGEKAVLSYTVGTTNVLELPAVTGAEPIFTRTFQLGPRDRALTLRVATPPAGHRLRTVPVPARKAGALPVAVLAGSGSPAAPAAVAFDGRTWLDVAKPAAFDLTSKDYSILVRVRTTVGGTIFCQTRPIDRWVPDGKTLFVRGGRLCFDIGWVGVVTGRTPVDDGRWHDVALTWRHDDGRVRLYVDGRPDATGTLKPKAPLADAVIRLGFSARDFPQPQSLLDGQLGEVRFYARALTEDEVKAAARSAGDRPLAHWRFDKSLSETVADRTGNGHDAHVRRAGATSRPEADTTLVAAVSGDVPGGAWKQDGDGALLLHLPAGNTPLRFTLAVQTLPLTGKAVPVDELAVLASQPVVDLGPLVKGGPRRWTETLTTTATLGGDAGPFAVDVLTPPTSNPWFCQMRLTGFDFFDAADRAAVCTWDGDVWLVSGLTAPPAGGTRTVTLRWQRIASGLFQPLGLKIVKGRIFVTCRDQLVALHDLNGDGEADFYECFNSDHQVTEHFHEFAMGLQVDARGDVYYAKSARHALPALVPHHGTLLRIRADGSRTDILANGFRAANGVCINPDGTFVVTDQEGHWTPKNRINWVSPPKPGEQPRFYGNLFGYHAVTDVADAAMEPPLCWITNAFDRSPAELLWVTSDAWKPLKGSLLNLSYGYGKVYVVPFETVAGKKQGGMAELPLPAFPTGVMRGRFHPTDGQLYLCGMFAWAGNATQPGGFYRVRYTGKPLHVPVSLRARSNGVLVTFSAPLDRATATDAARYEVRVWGLKRTANYGSDHVNERVLPVTAATLCANNRSVFLSIPTLAPTWGMSIRATLKGAAGEPVPLLLHNTIHGFPDKP